MDWISLGTASASSDTNLTVSVLRNDPVFNTLPLTVMAWVKTANSGFAMAVSKYNFTANGFYLGTSSGYAYGYYVTPSGSVSAYTSSSGILTDNQWHQIAFTVSTNGGRVYVDGADSGVVPWSGVATNFSTTAPLQFGVDATGYYPYTGVIRRGQHLERGTERHPNSCHSINRLLGTETNLIGYWKMDEGSGTIARDASPFANSARLLNGPTWVPSALPFTNSSGTALQFNGAGQSAPVDFWTPNKLFFRVSFLRRKLKFFPAKSLAKILREMTQLKLSPDAISNWNENTTLTLFTNSRVRTGLDLWDSRLC